MALLLLSIAVPAAGFATAALARLASARTHRWSLGWAASALCGIVGAAAGASAMGLALGRPLRQVPTLVVVGAVIGTAVVLGGADLFARRRLPPPVDARPADACAAIRAGESARVEFKSSARYNRHTGARDARLEQVIAASVAAFFNSAGGTLLIGVADDGSAIGVEADYGLLKNPGRDGYELWLHDLLATTLGASAAAQVGVSFERIDECDVCLVRVPPAPRPVYLQPPKQRGSEFVVRVGNSTRRLDARELVEYAITRWGARALRGRSNGGASRAAPIASATGPDARVAPNAPVDDARPIRAERPASGRI
jgi:uncharacterized membrane protein YeaQ/YmgE (transglycosylase-associated protein family)